ncbi:hypothetical protein WJX79_007581 [Trebouxia sp. C0005]
MVKALPGLSTAHLAGKKLQPSGIVYKRQRKLRTASGSLCEELLDRKPPSSLASGPQRKPDGKPELARLAHIKQSSNYAAPATSADQKPPKGAQQSPRIALGDVQQHTLDCQSDPQSLPTNHPALQTPDAVALAKYHPNFQAKYREYVCCMESSQSALTPMPLEDFCRLAGKGAKGLPVFNT